jgi:2-amino-4-hydroxy-6-hydroxymethyldihydropteridine diphosphokinase
MNNDSQATAYLSLGSNINDRLKYLNQAQQELSTHKEVKIVKSSQVYETQPWPQEDRSEDRPHAEKGQEWFLNQVIEIQTTLSPQKLLEVIQQVEKELGRTKKHHWGPREIDIDILLYGKQFIDSPELEIPHRHLSDRQFVLVPLVEIAPKLKHPVTGELFRRILEGLNDEHKVIPFL